MRRLLALFVVPLLFLAACGDDGDTSTSGQSVDEGAEALDGVTVNGGADEAPTLTFDQPFAVDSTVRKVIDAGTGETLADGMTVGFDYIAVNGRDGNLFDTSFDAGAASVTLDDEELLPGLYRGLLGINVGSRVLIGIHPDDAFGPSDGAAEVGIEADDSVLFLIDVLEVRHPLERAEGTPVEPVAGQPTVTLDDNGKPTIDIPETDAPPELVVQPLIQGDGAVVEAGQTVSVHYTGIVWATGEQFDSSWDRETPASFPIGIGSVIEGWDTGLVGQKVGSQVLLVIPPAQGYGPDGNPDANISGTDTLVFVIDILDAY